VPGLAQSAAVSAAPLSLSADEARRLFLRAQGVLGATPAGRPDRRVRWMLERVGAVQLDTISVLARSHELVAFARLGAVGRPAVERAYWGGGAFEYWAHAASVVPIEAWPMFAGKRRRYRERVQIWGERVTPEVRAEALARVRDLGPITSTELGGARKGGPWWDWSPLKVAVEQLLAEGEVVCVTRRGWRRVYDLASRAVPAHLLRDDMSDEECAATLCESAAERLGVATAADIADYYRLRPDAARLGMAAAQLVPARVEGWGSLTAYLHPSALPLLEAGVRGRHRTTLLSPFDSLIWFRRRAERMLGFKPPLELYVPAAKRTHGYFSMPLLAGGRLRGHVDPARAGRTLVARQVGVETPAAVEAMAAALVEAATWVGCDNVAVESVTPTTQRAALDAALRAVA
jgi:uncharacterized protein YcaQ